MQGAISGTTTHTRAMPRSSKPRPSELTINLKSDLQKSKDEDSPDPKSSPMGFEGIDLSSLGGDIGSGQLGLTSLPPLPPSAPSSPKHSRDPSKNFLSNFKNRTATEQEQREQDKQSRRAKDDDEYRPGSSSMSKIYHLRKNPGSTPELSLVGSAENVRKQSENAEIPNARPQPSPHHSEDSVNIKRKEKAFRNPLALSKSIRRDSNSKSRPNGKPYLDQPPKTAPISADWQHSSEMFLKAKGKDKRGKSAERAVASESEENLPHQRTGSREAKGGFVIGSKNVMSKAVTGGGNFFNRLGKIGRSSSSTEKEIPDSEYVLKLINLPLIEQTRMTRISKELGNCRDKTEYWMPSLPWRCIDYLNLNCESEGLYRVPGSGPQVKHWQRRFDSELDVDLLDEQDLYDPNTIGSMLKSWLRDLPTEIMKKSQQEEIAEELAKDNPEYQKIGQSAPQKLRDALSELPPFNYYLLFAITCHLSLLLSHKEKNKMDLNNLSICIGPCLNLDRWLFNYLVGDWRHCWQGCYTEKQFLEAEKAHEQGIDYEVPVTRGQQEKKSENGTSMQALNERAVHSSGSGETGDASRQGSQYEDGRSAPQSPHHKPENVKPDTYLPAVPNTNGAVDREQFASQDAKRPSTAGEKKQIDDGSKNGPPTPRLHSRSQSDAPLTPVKSNSSPSLPALPFQVRDQ